MKSKLAIVSFISSLLGLIIILAFPLVLALFDELLKLVPLFIFIGFITSIISLIQIKRKSLEGKWFAISSFIISLLILILLIFLIFNPIPIRMGF